MGLCNRIVAKGKARVEAQKLAQELARFPQICLQTEAQAGAARFDAWSGRGASFEEL